MGVYFDEFLPNYNLSFLRQVFVEHYEQLGNSGKFQTGKCCLFWAIAIISTVATVLGCIGLSDWGLSKIFQGSNDALYGTLGAGPGLGLCLIIWLGYRYLNKSNELVHAEQCLIACGSQGATAELISAAHSAAIEARVVGLRKIASKSVTPEQVNEVRNELFPEGQLFAIAPERTENALYEESCLLMREAISNFSLIGPSENVITQLAHPLLLLTNSLVLYYRGIKTELTDERSREINSVLDAFSKAWKSKSPEQNNIFSSFREDWLSNDKAKALLAQILQDTKSYLELSDVHNGLDERALLVVKLTVKSLKCIFEAINISANHA